MGDKSGISKKRKMEIDDKEHYLMAIALLTAKRSPDPDMGVGACIADADGNVVGIGYNRHPYGCEGLSWDKKEKHKYVCHAELNAILNKNSVDVKGCSIYVTLLPCNECAKIIIQSRIKEVVYLNEKMKEKRHIESRDLVFNMFKAADVRYRKLEIKDKIEIILELENKYI
ncbi:deoxycytidylate deaminase-like isoform X2 [Cydia pomonella]|uniref:deoxycytidylate deaminase-like isoform X2 n=1 Tax=Cydia pomonella TaxID=82600 RepID=UPI002ADE32B5|nr:deoxycytidylate deaminase-like isoform X2 [Cydia pomonella]